MAVLLAIGSMIYLIRTNQTLLDQRLIKLVILTLPLWLMTSGMMASQWDEFSYWLPSTMFLLNHDGFPDSANNITGGTFPAYPYGWPLLMYLSGKLSGQFLENSGALLNLFVLFTFGLVLLEVINKCLKRADDRNLHGWMVIALGGLLVTALNPTFVQKIILTAYSETSTSVTIALAGILAWMMLDALAIKDQQAAFRLAWQTALVLSVHINVRQANLILFIILVFSLLVIGIRDKRINHIAMFRCVGILSIPAIMVYVTWRFHVDGHLSGAEFSVRPFENWLIDLIPEILAAMFTVASKKGVYFTIMAIVIIFGARGLWRMETSLDRLSVLASIIFLGYNAFLLFSYVTAFGKSDALRVASYWRYNIHAGLFANVFLVFCAAILWQKREFPDPWPKLLGGSAILILLIAPLVFAEKLRFDHEGRKPHYQMVAMDLRSLLPEHARYFIVDPKGNGEVGVITKFRFGNPAAYGGVMSAFHPLNPQTLKANLKNSKSDFVLIHSSFEGLDAVFGLKLMKKKSYLLKRTTSGWSEVHSWLEKTK